MTATAQTIAPSGFPNTTLPATAPSPQAGTTATNEESGTKTLFPQRSPQSSPQRFRPVEGLDALPLEQRGRKARSLADYEWWGAVPMVLIHLGSLGAIWTGVHVWDVVCCVALYWIRMFGVTGGYHRYFAHRSYKTSRVMQFFLAFLAQSSAQKGALWWAAHHRRHHLTSDTPKDVHSPIRFGFLHSHIGWLFDRTAETDWRRIQDFQKYPELVFLNRFWYIPPTLLGIAVYLTLGFSGLWFGFMFSTVLLWHGTFTINSLSHMFGRRRYETPDDSRNNWLLAIITMGEGWHNNHHFYKDSARQGFRWWEYDFTFYTLKVMSWFGLVWDLRSPPKRVLEHHS